MDVIKTVGLILWILAGIMWGIIWKLKIPVADYLGGGIFVAAVLLGCLFGLGWIVKHL